MKKEIRIYRTKEGKEPFLDWLKPHKVHVAERISLTDLTVLLL